MVVHDVSGEYAAYRSIASNIHLNVIAYWHVIESFFIKIKASSHFSNYNQVTIYKMSFFVELTHDGAMPLASSRVSCVLPFDCWLLHCSGD